MKKARRMDRDSDTPNIWWRITVEPGGNGDVTITLPATTDCTDDGAICTEGRPDAVKPAGADRQWSGRLGLSPTGGLSSNEKARTRACPKKRCCDQIGSTMLTTRDSL